MSRRIAVEDGLSNVAQALRNEGFDVIRMTSEDMANVDACVISGMSDDFMGIEDTQGNRFPVIEANGLTAGEIVNSLQARLENQGS